MSARKEFFNIINSDPLLRRRFMEYCKEIRAEIDKERINAAISAIAKDSYKQRFFERQGEIDLLDKFLEGIIK